MHGYSVFIHLLLFFSLVLSTGKSFSRDIDISDYLLEKVYDLPAEVSETSGLIFYDSLIWTFNDSGNRAVLYGLDIITGEIKKRIFFKNAVNNDWEDITQNENSIFIADVGNNSGDRRDLTIYILDKDSINFMEKQHAEVKKIQFGYEDQTTFSSDLFNTQYDCEAIYYDHDSLYILTKNWVDENTSIYSLPSVPGIYKARLISVFDSQGLITGADHNINSGAVVLCGYKQYVPIILHFGRFSLFDTDLSKLSRLELFSEFGLQVEGICFIGDEIFVSAENSSEIQSLYKLVEN
jgi:hypothetical protein